MYSDWYVINVKIGDETHVCQRILDEADSSKYITAFVPMVEEIGKKNGEYITKIKPVFPGYFFVITKDIDNFFPELHKIMDFKKVLDSGNCFTPILQEEADFIASLLAGESVIRVSTAYKEGDRVVITDGPMLGKEAQIIKIDRHHKVAFLRASLGGRPVEIEAPLAVLNKE